MHIARTERARLRSWGSSATAASCPWWPRTRPPCRVRAALEGRFEEALALAGGADERDEHGRILRAHQPDDVIAVIEAAGAPVEAWYGLQVATAHQLDVVASDVVAPAVDLELRLGRTDPLRRVARLFHVIACRSTGPAGGW